LVFLVVLVKTIVKNCNKGKLQMKLPASISPMLATLGTPFDSNDYTYEIKWDGYRCLAFLDSGTKLQSRNLKDLTSVFPELNNLHQLIKKTGCVIDGEIIALRNGKPSFLELQKRGQLRNPNEIKLMKDQVPVIFVAFDLLFYDYKALFHTPIELRRELLEENIITAERLIVSKEVAGSGIKYFEAISKMGLEGVIAKKKQSIYLPGKRVKTWLKFKTKKRNSFIICGYVINPTTRGELSSLILGLYNEDRLICCGMVGTGFTKTEPELIHKELIKLTTDICPFTKTPNPLPNTFWTKPVIVCEIEYTEMTDEHSLRHPSFKRINPTVIPENCQLKELDNENNYPN